MNRRTFFYLVAVLVVALLVYSFNQALKHIDIPLVANTTTAPTISSDSNGAATLSIPTAFGYVNVRNFLSGNNTVTRDSAIVSTGAHYKTVYFFADKSFLITLLVSPLSTSRSEAEQQFALSMGIEAPEICKLRVSLTVPQEVDATAGGREYGLSMCPDSKPLP